MASLLLTLFKDCRRVIRKIKVGVESIYELVYVLVRVTSESRLVDGSSMNKSLQISSVVTALISCYRTCVLSIRECVSTPYVGLVGSKCTLSINSKPTQV